MDATKLLLFNAALQIAFSSIFGIFMLIPLQNWGKKWRDKFPRHALLAAHLDWIMLGLAQGLAAGGIAAFGGSTNLFIPALLIFGGWINPVPYLFRGFGINAFVFAGPLKQKLATTLSGTSSIAIIIAWCLLVKQWWDVL